MNAIAELLTLRAQLWRAHTKKLETALKAAREFERELLDAAADAERDGDSLEFPNIGTYEGLMEASSWVKQYTSTSFLSAIMVVETAVVIARANRGVIHRDALLMLLLVQGDVLSPHVRVAARELHSLIAASELFNLGADGVYRLKDAEFETEDEPAPDVEAAGDEDQTPDEPAPDTDLRDTPTPEVESRVASTKTRANPYEGMTTRQAATAILRELQKPTSSRNIAALMVGRGFEHSCSSFENFVSSVRSVLRRSDDFKQTNSGRYELAGISWIEEAEPIATPSSNGTDSPDDAPTPERETDLSDREQEIFESLKQQAANSEPAADQKPS